MANTYTIGNLTNSSNTITLNGTGASVSGNTITLTGTGSSGSGYTIGTGTTTGPLIYTSTGTGVTWTNPNEAMTIKQGNPAELEVKGKMVLNGRDLEERLETIEKVLNIPERDVKLEKKHPRLKKMYDDYIKALAKYRTWEAIKGDEDGTT